MYQSGFYYSQGIRLNERTSPLILYVYINRTNVWGTLRHTSTVRTDTVEYIVLTLFRLLTGGSVTLNQTSPRSHNTLVNTH